MASTRAITTGNRCQTRHKGAEILARKRVEEEKEELVR
jgi:hypothetical protein